MKHRPGLKKYGYLLFLMTPTLPVVGLWLGSINRTPDLGAWFTVACIFVLIPIADHLIGLDQSNPQDMRDEVLQSNRWYKGLLALCPPLMVCVLTGGAWVFVNGGLGWVGKLGWTISLGLVSGALAINAAHELIHKRSRLERAAGGFLLALVCYASFKVEHIRGHHVRVATPHDTSTARRGESLYRFLARAWTRNCVDAWRLEAQRLAQTGRRPWSVRNELLGWYALSIAIVALLWAWLGIQAVAFFVLQAFAAITFLETVNYLEHYGLQRRRLPDGRYERTTHQHSWNSNYLLTNLLLFQLQRHSDHHANPSREYHLLRHYEDSPQLPAGYATMMVLALVPPLWRRVMHPRLQAHYAAVGASGL